MDVGDCYFFSSLFLFIFFFYYLDFEPSAQILSFTYILCLFSHPFYLANALCLITLASIGIIEMFAIQPRSDYELQQPQAALRMC